PGSEDFDLITLYGDNCSGINALEQLEMMPFMAKYRQVILKNFDKMKSDDKNLIAEYLENPVPTSILVLTAEKLDGRITANKKISRKALNITCQQPYNQEDIIRWLRNELRQKDINMNNEAINLFANSIETDYMIASNELEKLIILTKNARDITLDDVIESVGKSRANTIFELQNNLGRKDLKKSLSVLENMFANEDPPKIAVFIVTMITRFFFQIWKIIALRKKNISDSEITGRHLNDIYYKYRNNYLSYANNYTDKKLKHNFSLLLQADIELKSLNIKEEIILETLIFNICRDTR
ncbi:MAG: DNA polymerase III subunit delta, partial [Candidatus Cloacimonetes bacterium]|nr:DNA polymerase III subunit delta [Candidatus Cloacimonadota bacterium]